MIIYKITNKINNKVYIGLTTQTVETRWKQHIQTAFSENHPDSQTIFKKAIRKYGPDNFKIEVIDAMEVRLFSFDKRRTNYRINKWRIFDTISIIIHILAGIIVKDIILPMAAMLQQKLVVLFVK